LDPGDFIGKECGKIRGIGPLLIYNSRDDQLFPTRVFYLESSLQQFGDYVGTDFNYGNLLLDARKLFPLKKNKVVATNLYAQFNSEGAPFFALAQLGGNKVLRGLFEGKFRDRNVLALQGEYRWMFLERWGAVAFGGIGNVFSADNLFQADQTKVAYGLGSRFKLTKKKKLNLRLDLAHSPGEDLQFYFTFGEAF
jgi:outer membrane protein assembly factor BamA